NILLCSICAVVLTGTTYPLFAELVFGAKLSVGPPYFQSTVFPLAVPLFLAMSLGPVLPWKRAELWPALLKLWWAALIAAAIGMIAALGLRYGLASLGFAASAWLICGAFAEVVERTRLFRAPFATFRARVAAQPLSVWGSAVAHSGMGVTVAGIAGMSLAASTIVAVNPGQSVQLAGYDWTLLGLHDEQGPNYTARVADVRVTRGGQEVVTFHPSRRMFTVQKTAVTDTAIETNGFRDLYAVLGEERDGAAVLRLHVNPLAPWIWLGALVMAIGGALSLADRRLRVGAPSRRAAGMQAGVVP
ncbi:MAG TPA: cytochrome c-type biogenesis CcmF C-terminal domain-containing protein, partial [Acetobacteraceae bacterium]|nr:cytochrome c-type biogenesis CcmF C-terminal domain-containing protein [Acetobacteraceae bacterium]